MTMGQRVWSQNANRIYHTAMKIFLCGFTGSGKTTLFKRIVQNSENIQALELDDLVKSELGIKGETLGDTIRRVGMEGFRETERKLLNQQFSYTSDLLIGLGGGSLSEESIKKIETDKDSKLIWVKTDFETCWNRIAGDENRPLVVKGRAYLEELYKQREQLYKKASISLESEAQNNIFSFKDLTQN